MRELINNNFAYHGSYDDSFASLIGEVDTTNYLKNIAVFAACLNTDFPLVSSLLLPLLAPRYGSATSRASLYSPDRQAPHLKTRFLSQSPMRTPSTRPQVNGNNWYLAQSGDGQGCARR